MRALYLDDHVRDGLGPALRPGGERLTIKMLNHIRPHQDHSILDAGCGAGATLELLHRKGLCKAVGVDLDAGLLDDARKRNCGVARSDMATLPIAGNSVDMILCECAWNLTRKSQALSEFARILKPGGYLGLSDIYLRNPRPAAGINSWPQQSCFFKATDLHTVREMITGQGFEIQLLEDHSRLLKQTAAEFVFAHGSLQSFWRAIMGTAEKAENVCTAAAETRPGLFMLIAQRNVR